jgi:hypothetical protein
MQPVYCPACGNQNASDANVCTSCTLALSGGQPIRPQPSAPMWKDIYGHYRGTIIFGAIIGLAYVIAILSRVDDTRQRVSAREGARPTRPAPPAPPAIAPPGPPAPPSNPNTEALGLRMSQWEEIHGASERVESGSFHHYESGRFVVRFTDSKATHVEKVWGDRNAIPFEQARDEVKQLMPKDAKQIRSYVSRAGRKVDLYSSEYLREQFPNERWPGGRPGNFIVIYRENGKSVTSILLANGNNP